MSRKREDDAPPPETAAPGDSPGKAKLRREMQDARRDISETVAEIKSVVAHQYEEVKETVETVREGVGEVVDWRADFERNPLVWGAGAVSIGILIGFGIARAFDDEDEQPRRGRRRKEPGPGERLAGELGGFADAVLPTISGKVKEFFGLDLDSYLRAERERRRRPTLTAAAKRLAAESNKADKSPARKTTARKKTAARKTSSKKGGAASRKKK